MLLLVAADLVRTGRRVGGDDRTRRAFALVVLVVLVVLLPLTPASAHTSLLRSTPADGSVVAVGPRVITLTFDEAVRSTSSSIRVSDARGRTLPATVEGRDQVVSASVPRRLADGSYVVDWRVISVDGHPAAGSITFSVGAPSATVVRPPRALPGTDAALTRTLRITAALNYLSLFLAGGLVLFSLWVLGGVEVSPVVGGRLTMGREVAACVAALTAVTVMLLQGADDAGLGIHAVGDPASLDWSLVGDQVVVLGLQVAGLVAGLLLMRRHRWLSTAGIVVAVAAPALVGHSRSHGPQALVLPADALHLLAGATWLGGLVGLGLTLGSLRGRERDAAVVLSRFSAIGATVLAALTVTGVLAAWRILAAWSSLFHTGYGKVLLVKVAVVAVAALVAGLNRWRLLPRVVDDLGRRDRGSAALRVRTAVWCEAGLLVVVLGLTGFLTNLAPEQHAATGSSEASRASATAHHHRVAAAPSSPTSSRLSAQTLSRLNHVRDTVPRPNQR